MSWKSRKLYGAISSISSALLQTQQAGRAVSPGRSLLTTHPCYDRVVSFASGSPLRFVLCIGYFWAITEAWVSYCLAGYLFGFLSAMDLRMSQNKASLDISSQDLDHFTVLLKHELAIGSLKTQQHIPFYHESIFHFFCVFSPTPGMKCR